MTIRDEGYALLGDDPDAVPDGTRLTMHDGRSYVVVRDPQGWHQMLFRAGDDWLHAADPLSPAWGFLRDDGVDPDAPTWDDVAVTRCCWRHSTGG